MAGPLPPPSLDLDEDEIVPDSELEFEDLENAVQNEASGDSSDDFVPEGSSQSNISEDDVPLSTTISNNFARPSSSKAGPSSKTLKGRRSVVRAQPEADLSDWSDTEDSFVTSAKAPRRNKAAPKVGKGRKSAPQPRRRRRPQRGRHPESDESDQAPDNSDDLLEPSDEDAKPPPRGLHPHQTHSLIKAAERKMRKKLGRKLTLVLPSITSQNSLILTTVPSFFQSEKSTAQLHLFHPELKSCWGDLKKSVAIVTPKKAEQPENLRATLLPFQQESLYWMKKQECGPWHGGILAVSLRHHRQYVLLPLIAG